MANYGKSGGCGINQQQLDDIETDTDLLPAIKTETDKIPSIIEDTDKIDSIVTETDKIPDIKLDTDLLPDIKTETDKIPSILTETDKIQSIKTETNKMDLAPGNGLLGVPNSLSYGIAENDRHNHSSEYWFGAAVTPDLEVHVADRIGPGVVAFQLLGGTSDYGNFVLIHGSEDTTTQGFVKGDAHRMMVDDVSTTAVTFVRFYQGESAARVFLTEVVIKAQSNQIDSGPIEIQMPRIDFDAKIWAQCMTLGESAKTVDFYYGIHGYEG